MIKEREDTSHQDRKYTETIVSIFNRTKRHRKVSRWVKGKKAIKKVGRGGEGTSTKEGSSHNNKQNKTKQNKTKQNDNGDDWNVL